jgi:glucose-1-phosphatase
MTDRFVYFDLGNVLVHFDHEIAAKQLAALAECSLADARHVIFGSGLEDRWEMGAVTSSEFARIVNQTLKSQVAEEAIIEAVSAIFRPNDSILAALDHVKQSGVRMAVLSNTCEGHWLWLRRHRWPMIENWFNFHVLSYEVKAMKPAPKIYQLCEQRCGLTANQIFFTDDRLDNIQAAADRGWGTYHFQNAKGLIDAFDDWMTALGK